MFSAEGVNSSFFHYKFCWMTGSAGRWGLRQVFSGLVRVGLMVILRTEVKKALAAH
jgi:hypothetical protein